MSDTPLIAVQSVSKSYRSGAVRAVRQVSFVVQRGEFVHITGPSGSGKTTLLNLIAALDLPDAGGIIVGGTDVTRLSPAHAAAYRNAQIGIVFQSYNLFQQLTAVENVLVPMIPRRSLNRRFALELLDNVGLSDRSEHRPAQLSGGEQQRVAIARALANDPPLVLADEPTGNLDDENSRNVMSLLCKSCRERGKTLVVAAHDNYAMHSPDAIFEMRAGMLTPRIQQSENHAARDQH
jgi:putative ABC transport system ATP-binding protein